MAYCLELEDVAVELLLLTTDDGAIGLWLSSQTGAVLWVAEPVEA